MNKESIRTWGIILVLLIVASSAAVLWPSISGQFGGSTTRVPAETQDVVINLPAIGGLPDSVSLAPVVIMGGLFAIIVGAVVGAGVVLGFVYTRLSAQTAALTEDEEYSKHVQALEERSKEQIGRLSEGRGTMEMPDHKMPRWSVLSTSLIFLMFVLFFGMLLSATFVPEGKFVSGNRLISASLPISGGLVLVTLIALIWRFRTWSPADSETSDNESIPWDAIWVILTGVLVVGLGLGLVVYLNVPA